MFNRGKEVNREVLKLNQEKKLELYEGIRKLVVEILVETISGVISKLISGGAAGRTLKEAS